ncbi:hypothetical protein GN958_ATG13533 [Phytophthora infestans]|uniref:Uncharacterized protein n=1 Tax=Phytophthora infestans TaxID=4787 RepID=A0A8S9U9X6_PHYIN|nr:hypothetical protein GN958_ATG13533 [Phytophthora infestans]
MLLAFGAKQLRAACYCRQLRIVKSGAECNDNKLGYVALLMKLKRAYAEMQQLQAEGGPPKAVIEAVPNWTNDLHVLNSTRVKHKQALPFGYKSMKNFSLYVRNMPSSALSW